MLTFMLPHWDLRSTETAILVIILILFLSFKPTEKLCWVKVPRTWCRKGIYFITSNKSKDGSVFQSWLIQSGTHHESFSARMALYFEGTLRHLYLTNPGKRPRQLLSNGISPIFTVEQRANTSEEWSLYNKYYQWINSWHFFFVLVLPHLFLTNTLLCSHDFMSESLRAYEGEVSIMYTYWKVLSHQLGFAGLFKSSSV